MRIRGMIRKLDKLNRLVIPREYTKLLDMKVGDRIISSVVENCLVICKENGLYTDGRASRVDSLNRISIAVKNKELLNIGYREELEMFLTDDCIIIRKKLK